MMTELTITRKLLPAGLMVLGLILGVASAAEIGDAPSDTERVTSTTDDRSDTPVVSPETTVDDRDGRILTSDQVDQLVNPTTDEPSDYRPPRPEYRNIPPELARKLREFRRFREQYLLEQERLIKLYKGATEPERDLIRQKLQLRREEWLERSRNIKEDSRERLRDLMRELPKHREALDAAREAARDQLHEVPRRGVDD